MKHYNGLTCLDSFITSLTSLYPTKGRKISREDVKEQMKPTQGNK